MIITIFFQKGSFFDKVIWIWYPTKKNCVLHTITTCYIGYNMLCYNNIMAYAYSLHAYKTKPSDHFIFYFLLWWWCHGSLGSAVCSIWWRFGWMPYARMHANIMHINVRVIVISSWSLAWSGLAKQEQKHRNLHSF